MSVKKFELDWNLEMAIRNEDIAALRLICESGNLKSKLYTASKALNLAVDHKSLKACKYLLALISNENEYPQSKDSNFNSIFQLQGSTKYNREEKAILISFARESRFNKPRIIHLFFLHVLLDARQYSNPLSRYKKVIELLSNTIGLEKIIYSIDLELYNDLNAQTYHYIKELKNSFLDKKALEKNIYNPSKISHKLNKI